MLGNLFRDQLDRYGELELIARRLAATSGQALGADGTLVCNADDPLVASIGRDRQRLHLVRARRSLAGAASRCSMPPTRSGASRCGARYAYDAVYLGHLGALALPGLRRRPAPALDVAAREVASRRPGRGRRSASCTAAGDGAPCGCRCPASTTSTTRLPRPRWRSQLGAGLEQVRAGLERFSAAFGRFERIDLAGGEAVLLLVKNPAGGNEVIRTLAADPDAKRC